MKSNLKTLRDRIKNKLPELTHSQKLIVNYFLESPEKIALSSLRELERELKVSKSTIVRLTQALGYKGFQELKSAFLKSIRMDLDPIDRYKTFLAEDRSEMDRISTSYLRLIADETVHNIKETLRLLDDAQYMSCIQMLKKARQVYTMGLGISSYLAEIAAYLLNRVSIKAHCMVFSGLSFAEQMINVSEQDLVLAFSLMPYSRDTVEAAAYAREKGIKIISITDKATSDIVPYSDVFLRVSVDSASFSNSISSVIVLLSAIVTRIGYELKDKTLVTIGEIERVRAKRSNRNNKN
ncbi:MAG: MurR/RpiR family transcriptional regulator [Candidatus Aminicenantes bacterium]|nr:MurR/RpiR family transcriptional regulator [Candidatus Aminicenantes bacterium]